MPFPTAVDAITDSGSSIGHVSQVLGPQRITVGPTMFNVLSDVTGPADPTGATDSSTAIANAQAAAAAVGGQVWFPQGTYSAKALNIDTNTHWYGMGEGATILQLLGSSNTFLLQTTGFASLAAGGGGSGPGTSTGGPTNFSINNMTLDGNKANNGSATVPVVRLYGFGFRLSNLRIRNGNNDGLYSEWSTSLPSPGADSMMALLYAIKAHDNGKAGVHWNGPHDTQWALAEVYNNNTSAGTGAAGAGIWADTKGTGLILIGPHSWGLSQSYACYFGATGCGASACTFEGAVTAQLGIDANDCWVAGGFIYGAGASVPKGIVLGVTGARQDIALTGAKIDNCTSGALDLTNDGGALIVADIFQSGGTLLVGTPSINTRMTLRTNGVAGSVDRLNGGLEVHGGNTLKLFSAADGGFVTLAFDGSKLTRTWPLVGSVQTPAFTASYTPNLAAGDVIAMAALTGAITVNAPTGLVPGQTVTFIWLQDGTGGRVVTYNAVYKTGGGTAATTALNTRMLDTFVSDDGTNLRLISRITGQ